MICKQVICCAESWIRFHLYLEMQIKTRFHLLNASQSYAKQDYHFVLSVLPCFPHSFAGHNKCQTQDCSALAHLNHMQGYFLSDS